MVTAAINQDAETGDGEIAQAAVVRVKVIIGLVDALAEAVAEQITGAAELDHNALIKLASKLTASVHPSTTSLPSGSDTKRETRRRRRVAP